MRLGHYGTLYSCVDSAGEWQTTRQALICCSSAGVENLWEPGIADDELKACVCDSSEVASHGSLGIVDLGATKTVIGSKLVPDLLNNLGPRVRKQVTRCPCVVTFRFGNHVVLRSQQALVVPIPGLLLTTAVPGNTPFLLSKTLLRAIGATVDTANHVLHATKLDKSFPLVLTSRGLFLLDLNDLAKPMPESTISSISTCRDSHHRE